MNRELAQFYNLEGVKEVYIRKVEKEEVGIDLLELKFKVQIVILGRVLLSSSTSPLLMDTLLHTCIYMYMYMV